MKKQHLFFVICLCIISRNYKAQFTQGNLVVMQAGDGSTSLSSTGDAIVFKEYNPSGSLTYSVAIPSNSVNAILVRGNSVSEGYISRSADNHYIVFGGYKQTLPNTTVLNSAAASSINRAVGLLDASGNFILAATASVSSLASGDIRGACATNSINVWATSSSQGANYYGSQFAASNVENSKTNLRAAHIFNNQLYISSQVTTGTPGDIGIYAVGTGTPNSSAQTVSTVINAGTGALPGQFYFNNTGTICYVADARINSNGGGVQKWVQSSGVWSLVYTLATGTANIGAFGVVADFSGILPKVYATTTESSGNRLVAILDQGANSTATTIASANMNNTVFRGLAWSPASSTCIPVSVMSTSNNAPFCSNQSLVLNVNAAGSSPITYSWSGGGAFNSTAISNPTIMHSSSGVYTVLISNACGTASAAVNVSVNPSPSIQVNAATICSGGIATITASGADTYTWNNNSTAPSFTASPAVNTSYTVNGSSNAGCAANTVTTSITIVSSPSLTVNSPSICLGSNATLTAQGASTYSWTNITASTAIIVVSPTTNANYTVSANASGCPNTVSTVATVIVLPTPTVTITNESIQMCLQQKSITLTGSPSGGLFAGAFVSGAVFTPTALGSFAISYSYTNSNNCSNVKVETFSVSECTGQLDLQKEKQIVLFPNPAQNELFIQNTRPEHLQVNIFNVMGQKVLNVSSEQELSRINIEALMPGLYYVCFEGQESGQIRFIKQ